MFANMVDFKNIFLCLMNNKIIIKISPDVLKTIFHTLFLYNTLILILKE